MSDKATRDHAERLLRAASNETRRNSRDVGFYLNGERIGCLADSGSVYASPWEWVADKVGPPTRTYDNGRYASWLVAS